MNGVILSAWPNSHTLSENLSNSEFVKRNFLQDIERAGLVGRGGAAYPVAMKWSAVLDSLKISKRGYVIVNGAEGEPGVAKDAHILANYTQTFLDGLLNINDFFGDEKIKKIYIFLNHDYYEKYLKKIVSILSNKKFKSIAHKIEFFLKPLDSGYIGGEESTILNIIEGKRVVPRIRPPYPTTSGLKGLPTLIHNVETIYNIALLSEGLYEGKRFYTINGAARKPGVYYYPSDWDLEKVLRTSGNYPDFPFFVQIGGQASGEVLNSEQLMVPAESSASIMIYDRTTTKEDRLIKHWVEFFHNNSCGQCTACREGTYRLSEMLNSKEYDKDLFWDIVENMAETSFCALGSSLPIPLYSYYNNIKKYVRN